VVCQYLFLVLCLIHTICVILIYIHTRIELIYIVYYISFSAFLFNLTVQLLHSVTVIMHIKQIEMSLHLFELHVLFSTLEGY